MTTPDVPLRLEFEIEVPGTPEQVWDALATAAGISAWFLPTESEERLGGRLVTHMGPEDAPADIIGWDPPRRFAYEEDIAALAGAGARRDHAAGQRVPRRGPLRRHVRRARRVVGVRRRRRLGAGVRRRHGSTAGCRTSSSCASTSATSPVSGRRRSPSTARCPATPRRSRPPCAPASAASAAGDRIELARHDAASIERTEPVLLVRLDAPVPGMLRIATGGPVGAAVDGDRRLPVPAGRNRRRARSSRTSARSVDGVPRRTSPRRCRDDRAGDRGRGPRQGLRRDPRRRRHRPRRAPRHGVRRARPERRRQDDDDPHAGHAAAPRRRHGARARPRHRPRGRRGARRG